MKTRRFLLIALILAGCLFAATSLSQAWSGNGSTADPFQITSLEEFLTFAEQVNAGNSYQGRTFKLMTDLDLSGVCGADVGGEEVSWDPIGHASDITFMGIFDGGDHTISGLYINEDADYKGLFGHVTGYVKYLKVSGTVSGGNYTGGIAGAIDGNLFDSSFEGTVTGKNYTGGVAGYAGPDGGIVRCTSKPAHMVILSP